jgi:hypothetical protein
MRSLALVCLTLVGLTSALPFIVERPVEQKPENGARVFVVQIDEAKPQQQEPPKPAEQPTRDFPWPYPPVFERYLPEEVKQRLTSIYLDQSLTSEERLAQTNAVFDSLPQAIIERLPLPAEFERLPFDVFQRIQYVHTAPGFRWAERTALTRAIIETLPENERQLLGTPRIGGPPVGFEQVLAPTVYKQLLFVHHNPLLSKEQKAHQITQIMRQVPQQQIDLLPLPRGMNELPAEIQKRLRTLVFDYTVEQPERAARVNQFVKQLPVEIRPALRR